MRTQQIIKRSVLLSLVLLSRTELTQSYARRANRLMAALQAVELATGGELALGAQRSWFCVIFRAMFMHYEPAQRIKASPTICLKLEQL